MAHTLLELFGFEDQQLERLPAPSGTAPTFDASTASYSRYAAKWDGVAAGVTGYVAIAFGTKNYAWISYHMYLTNLPGAGNFWYLNRIMGVGGGVISDLRIDDTGAVGIWNQTSGTWQVAAGTIAAGVYYVVSHFAKRNISVGFTVRNRDTGATVVSLQHSVALGNLSPGLTRWGPFTASRGMCSYDNISIEGDDVEANIDDPVNLLTTKYAVGMLSPTGGAGSYDAWTNTNANVDEFPHDGNTTTRAETGPGTAFTAPLTKCSALAAQVGTIHAIQHWALTRESAAGTLLQLRLRSATTDSDTASFEPNNSATVYTSGFEQGRMLLLDPATSSAWTVSAVDSVEVGVERVDTVDTTLCTQVGMEILYTVTTIDRLKKITYRTSAVDPQGVIYDDGGRRVPYNEVVPDSWMRILDLFLPTTRKPADFVDQSDMSNIEETTYEQDLMSGASLSLLGSPDDFAEGFIKRLTDMPGGV